MPTPAGSFELSVTLGDASFSAAGKPDLVLKSFEEFKELAGIDDGDGSASAGKTAREPRQRAAGPVKRKGSGDELPLPAFLDRLDLRGNKKIATAILAWTAQHGEKEKLTTAEIQEVWTQTKFKLPSSVGNLGRDLRDGVKEGWLKTEGKNKEQTFFAPVFGQNEVAKWAKAE